MESVPAFRRPRCGVVIVSSAVYVYVCAVGAELLAYPVEPLPSESFSPIVPIEPVVISPALWSLLQLVPGVLPSSLGRVGLPAHAGLGELIVPFLANYKSGRSEDALHGRDDLLMRLICTTSGGLEAERNIVAVSTRQPTRSDVYLAVPGCPPLVHVEERAQSGQLELACVELKAKFCPLPHYDSRLQFIIGIGIAGDWVRVGRLMLSGGAFQPLLTIDLAEGVGARMKAVAAAINVGRWARYAVAERFVAPIPFPIGQTQKDARREVTILSEGIVIKKYLALDAQQGGWLRQLYTSIAVEGAANRIRYMEYAFECSWEELQGTLKVKLRPFGVVATHRPPMSTCELRAALRCVLTCLGDLHACGWAHLDVRWSNVVFVSHEVWVLIDAEFARPHGSPLPSDLRWMDPQARLADEAADCYMVGMMMKSYAMLTEGNIEAQRLCDWLVASGSRSHRTVQQALRSPFLA